MSTKAPVKTQAKTPAAPAAAHIPQPPVAAPEHEAERPDIAAQLERATQLGHSLGAVGVDSSLLPIIQRQEIPEEEEEELQLKREQAAVQRQELPEEEEEELMLKPEEGRVGPQGGPVPPEVEAAITRARGGGQPLEDTVQAHMSEAMGHDFSRVRVHTDSEADELNQQLQAKAFTTGADIFFKRGAYDPASSGGQELIAHELSHVVHQSSGRVPAGGDGSGMTVRPAGDAFEQEADGVAEAVTRSMNTSVQRQTPDEEELQMQEEEAIQTQVSQSAPETGSEHLERRINGDSSRGKGHGEPIDKPLDAPFTADFNDVRVHIDSEAHTLNQHLRGTAFTTGPDILFKRGEYDAGPADPAASGATPGRGVVQRQALALDGVHRVPDGSIILCPNPSRVAGIAVRALRAHGYGEPALGVLRPANLTHTGILVGGNIIESRSGGVEVNAITYLQGAQFGRGAVMAHIPDEPMRERIAAVAWEAAHGGRRMGYSLWKAFQSRRRLGSYREFRARVALGWQARGRVIGGLIPSVAGGRTYCADFVANVYTAAALSLGRATTWPLHPHIGDIQARLAPWHRVAQYVP